MNEYVLEFEKPVMELEKKIHDLKKFSTQQDIDLSNEINKLKSRLEKIKKDIFGSLTPWQRVQLARHPKRPYTLDYINLLCTDFIELHGDGVYGDDKAIVSGIGKLNSERVVIIGHQKGRDIEENVMRNFGSAHPEGYRKAMRIMKLGEKYGLPVIIFIDTPGAYPGIGAEERGQAHSIANNLRDMIQLTVPIIIFVIGEGGSGGALGVGLGDRIYSLENSYYSVISPEGCAAILWRDRANAPKAAEALKLTAQDLFNMEIIDGIIEEPLGGAHRDFEMTAKQIKRRIVKDISELKAVDIDKLIQNRYRKFRKIGKFIESSVKNSSDKVSNH